MSKQTSPTPELEADLEAVKDFPRRAAANRRATAPLN
jgi:hypothetical protein